MSHKLEAFEKSGGSRSDDIDERSERPLPCLSTTAVPSEPQDVVTRTASPSSTPDTSSPEAGATIHMARRNATALHRDRDRYQMIGEHGRGGLGLVSRARDRDLGRDVAIKELIRRGPLSEVRFLREALITARLEHPGIVPVHEAGRWSDGTPFYAMKLVAGKPLRDLISERTTVQERIGLLHHVIAVADAIAYAHGRNIIHRDLKPANVIIGDFGETIVIDWGLAKDLSTPEEPAPLPRNVLHQNSDDGLTVTGSVLGTPTYMAPEQERGEHVDQRADVFAIGAMLWELCSIQKVPPTDRQVRHRLLRRAGIDHDLISIIDKALDPQRARRYLDAAALASDLKAFKVGARVAARAYTPFGMIAHWIRRHRTLVFAAATAILLLAGGAMLYVHNIATARDRAETANDKLTLEHAELLLQTDPTAAASTLTGYQGHEMARWRRLRAEAQGRGVANITISPHTDTVRLLLGRSSGEIISISEDNRLQSTHEGRSTTLTSDVASGTRVRYSPSADILTYATTPSGIAIVELGTKKVRRIPTVAPLLMDLSPDGSRLASLDVQGQLVVWQLNTDIKQVYKKSFDEVTEIKFATATILTLATRTAVRTLTLKPAGQADESWATADVAAIDAENSTIALGTNRGEIVVLSRDLVHLSSAIACPKRINNIRIIPNTLSITFACRDGGAGIAEYNPDTQNVTIIDTFRTSGSTVVTPDHSGRYISIIDESLSAFVYDTQTKLMKRYAGSTGKPTAVSTPTIDYGYVLIGDSNGSVRRWDPPSPLARVIHHAPVAIFGLSFTRDNKHIVATGSDRVVRVVGRGDGNVTELTGHQAGVLATRTSPDGTSLLSYGYDQTVRVWRIKPPSTIRVLPDHASIVEEAEYIEEGRRIVSIGDDGRLLTWAPSGGDAETLFTHPVPLVRLEILDFNNHIVVADKTGEVWDVSPTGSAHQVRQADGTTITTLRASPDGRWLATGTDKGWITIYNTLTWNIARFAISSGSIYQLEFDPASRDILALSGTGTSFSARVQLIALDEPRTRHWSTFTIPARAVYYAPDGESIALICFDGGIWLYSLHDDIWSYSRDHDSDTLVGAFSPDSQLFVSADRQGRVVARDVKLTFAAAVHTVH